MYIRMMLIFMLLMGTSACASLEAMKAANDFGTSSMKYNEMLRWHEMTAAGAKYADQSVKDEYIKRALAAKEVNIADYRVEMQDCTPADGIATVIVDIDYFIPPSVTLKTVEDVQKWKYVGKEGDKTWRLVSLPPEFK